MSDIELHVQVKHGDVVLGTLSAWQFMEWTKVKTSNLPALVQRFNEYNEQNGAPERAHIVIVRKETL
jgi:hypothetical protein